MATDRMTRKSILDIDEADLDFCPVWEIIPDSERLEGEDDLFFKAALESTNDPQAGEQIFRTIFTTATKEIFKGYIHPYAVEVDADIKLIRPVVFGDGGIVSIWHGIRQPNSEKLKKYTERLRAKNLKESFPIYYETSVEASDKKYSGSIKGFGYFDKNGIESYTTANSRFIWF